MQTHWLHRDYQLPQLSIKTIFWFVCLLALPNILFWILAFYFGTSRPILNTDYYLAVLLLIIPNKFFKYCGILLYLLFSIFDGLAFTIQVFPFLHLGAIRYLLPFAMLAPTRYIMLGTLLFAAMIFTAIAMLRISHKQNIIYSVFGIVLLFILAYGLKEIKYTNYAGGIMGRDNYYWMQSQMYLYTDATESGFADWMRTEPQISAYPAKKERAASHLTIPHSNKILYVVSESWGYPRTKHAQQLMLEKIAALPDLEFLQEGYFDFPGSTVQGEMRELCNFNIKNGYAFHQIPIEKFSSCLPAQLNKNHYYTYAMHGTSGRLYDRYNWYPKAGFQTTLFGENFPTLKRCVAFNGVCDSELFEIVADTFQQRHNDKIFFYWLTLTSHSPYPKGDIVNQRFNCQEFNMSTDGDICRNAQLQTQFLDNLAQLMSMPQMKGVEVIVVGDHMPPILTNEPIHPFLRWQDVSWLHFKIKP